jgi:hypothetical protein
MSRFTQETAEERAARLAEIRRQVDADAYETPERLNAAVDSLAEDLSRRASSKRRPK